MTIRSSRAMLWILPLLALALPPYAFAAVNDDGTAPTVSYADVDQLPIADGLAHDGSTIPTRNENGVTFRLSTTAPQPNAMHTSWWVNFNRPESCATPCACGAADLQDRAVEPGAFLATGRYSDGFGQLDLIGSGCVR